MRLIDADKLKDAIKEEQAEGFVHVANVFDCVYDHIDNAPTVELTETEVQEVLNKRCMTAVANEYLIALHNSQARPKGEWLEPYESKIAQECSICHRQMPAPKWFNFCPNCGADMRKGSELYREENCNRKSHCDDYKHWHCIGCNGCKKGGAEND